MHQVVSLAKRWLLGTRQGSVDEAHLASYLNEFVFRFNRRRSRSRGMVFYRVLELAVAHDPVRYQDLIATKRPRAVPSAPPQGRGHPPSLERPPAKYPSRTAGPGRVRLNGYPRDGKCLASVSRPGSSKTWVPSVNRRKELPMPQTQVPQIDPEEEIGFINLDETDFTSMTRPGCSRTSPRA